MHGNIFYLSIIIFITELLKSRSPQNDLFCVRISSIFLTTRQLLSRKWCLESPGNWSNTLGIELSLNVTGGQNWFLVETYVEVCYLEILHNSFKKRQQVAIFYRDKKGKQWAELNQFEAKAITFPTTSSTKCHQVLKVPCKL